MKGIKINKIRSLLLYLSIKYCFHYAGVEDYGTWRNKYSDFKLAALYSYASLDCIIAAILESVLGKK